MVSFSPFPLGQIPPADWSWKIPYEEDVGIRTKSAGGLVEQPCRDT